MFLIHYTCMENKQITYQGTGWKKNGHKKLSVLICPLASGFNLSLEYPERINTPSLQIVYFAKHT